MDNHFAAPKALLEINGLTTCLQSRAGNVPVIRDVMLTVGKGQVLGIVGESGSGKSVTMLSVMQLLTGSALTITAGSVKFNGEQLVGANEESLRRIRGKGMAMVYQNPMAALNPVMPIGRQIDEGMIAHGRSVSEARERTVHALQQVGIPDPKRTIASYPHQLSGGMCQRVMIAAALAVEPEILIFDEPTTALDVTIQQQILYLVQQLQAATGVAVIWITHDLGVLSQLVDSVAVMYGGRIVEVNSIDALFNAPEHPYTAALIASAPNPRTRGDRHKPPLLPQIGGDPPDPFSMPTGCPYASRCRYAIDKCIQHDPVLRECAQAQVACWNHGSLRRDRVT